MFEGEFSDSFSYFVMLYDVLFNKGNKEFAYDQISSEHPLAIGILEEANRISLLLQPEEGPANFAPPPPPAPLPPSPALYLLPLSFSSSCSSCFSTSFSPLPSFSSLLPSLLLLYLLLPSLLLLCAPLLLLASLLLLLLLSLLLASLLHAKT